MVHIQTFEYGRDNELFGHPLNNLIYAKTSVYVFPSESSHPPVRLVWKTQYPRQSISNSSGRGFRQKPCFTALNHFRAA
jgi:hypothetical protein